MADTATTLATKDTGTPMPRPPELSEIYSLTKTAGLGAVFTKWDGALRAFFEQFQQALTLDKNTPEMTGGRIMRPSERIQNATTGSGGGGATSNQVLGWVRQYYPLDDNSTRPGDPRVSSGGWPIALKYDRTKPDSILEVSYFLSLYNRKQQQLIPTYRKADHTTSTKPDSQNTWLSMLDLDDPHLRVSLVPIHRLNPPSTDFVMRQRAAYRNTWAGPGPDYGLSWQHFFWLEDREGHNVPIHSIYAELL